MTERMEPVCEALAVASDDRHASDDGSEATGPDELETIPGIDRLLALTDGVVAIALTLLVLQLQIPVSDALRDHPNSASALWDALDVDGSELTSYLVSFVVIAQAWLVHHRLLRDMRGHSEGLAWRNFGFLLALTLMPFTSDLLGRYGENPLAVSLFAANLVAISITTRWISLYALHHDLVKDRARSKADTLGSAVRSTAVISVAALAVLVAWTDVGLSKYVWLLYFVVGTVSVRITRRIEEMRRRDESDQTSGGQFP